MPQPSSAPKRRGRAIRVLIADDHRTFADALQVAIRLHAGISVVGVVHDGEAAVAAADEKKPDVILMDSQMPRLDGIAATRKIKEVHPDARVIMLSAFEDDRSVARAIDAGAAGFLSKERPVKDVASSIKAAFRGEPLLEPAEVKRILKFLKKKRAEDVEAGGRVERLTARETEILQLMADGLSPERVAERLGISRHTLRTHVQNVLFKLKVHSKLEALALAIRFGKVRVGEPV